MCLRAWTKVLEPSQLNVCDRVPSDSDSDKDMIDVPPLIVIDDIISISKYQGRMWQNIKQEYHSKVDHQASPQRT